MKNYLIIGASAGIGKTLSKKLADEGNKVFGTYNSTEPENQNDNIEYHQLNVLDDEIDIDFLPDVIDGLAYCPGSVNLKPFRRVKPEEMIDDYNLNLIGAVKVLQAAYSRLRKSESPSVVLFSTVAVQAGFQFHSIVSSSKGAVEGLAKSLAAELAPKIRVNCIAPSITDTRLAEPFINNEKKLDANKEKHPLKKIGAPDDIAEAASFLLSQKSGWITGQVMHVDGGMSSLRI